MWILYSDIWWNWLVCWWFGLSNSDVCVTGTWWGCPSLAWPGDVVMTTSWCWLLCRSGFDSTAGRASRRIYASRDSDAVWPATGRTIHHARYVWVDWLCSPVTRALYHTREAYMSWWLTVDTPHHSDTLWPGLTNLLNSQPFVPDNNC